MPIRLLIVDSIAALIRGADHAYGNTNRAGLAARSKYLCSVSDKLKALALEFNLAVVVVNQVSDVIERTVPSTNYRPIRPAAGGVTATPILRHGYSASQHSSQAPPSTPMLSQFYTDGAAPPMLYATQSRWFSGQTETLVKEASLGIVWANAINVRVMLSRTGRRRLLNQRDLSRPKPKAPYHDKSQNESTAPIIGNKGTDGDDTDGRPVVDDFRPTLIRRLHVVFSPFAPPSTTDYVITASGIHSVPDSYRLLDHAEARKKSDLLARLAAEAAVINGEDPVDSSREHEEDEDEDDEDDTTREARRRGQTDFEIDKQMRLNRQLDGFRPVHNLEDEDGDGEGAGTRREGSDGDEDFGGEVFDDFGDLPAEFWDLEGNHDGVPQSHPGDDEAREEGSAP
jgi:DNA repair protein RAD57